MARTKQTARKHTGKAPPKKRLAVASVSASAGSGSRGPQIPDDEAVVDKASIPRAPFVRVVKEITAAEIKSQGNTRASRRATPAKPGVRFQKETHDAIRDTTEAMIAGLFEDAGLVASHGGRKTVTKKDLEFVAKMKRR